MKLFRTKKNKIKIQICQSCGRDNDKSFACFRQRDTLEGFYRDRILALGKRWAGMEIRDCLTNCDTPNSVRIETPTQSFDFAWVSSEEMALKVIEFAHHVYENPKAMPASPLKHHLLDKQTGRGKARVSNTFLVPKKPKPVWMR